MRRLIILPVLALCACSAYQAGGQSTQSKVRTSSGGAIISQLTAGTWIAVSQDATAPLPRSARDKAELINAITTVSGCKVTDSNYSRDGLQLDAQIECNNPRAN